MCEYCGCQEIGAIAELTREHDAVVAEIARVRAFLRDHDVAGAAESARRISRILGPHTAVEEGGLFPHLVPDFPDHVANLEAEHREIEAVLRPAAEGTPTDPRWPDQLLAAMERLRDHILKEQDGLFPASLSILDASDWATVEAARDRVGTALHHHDPDSPHADHDHDHDVEHHHIHQHA